MNSVRISTSLYIYARVCIRVFIVGCLKRIISNSNRISWNECILQVNLIYHSKAALKIKCRKLNYPLTMSSKFIDCMPLKKHGAFCYCGWKRKTIASDTKEKNLQLGRKKTYRLATVTWLKKSTQAEQKYWKRDIEDK